jgi:mannose-6-phosphate isomerase class I
LTHPDIYKDPNPKPEVAIALSDDFKALFGFSTIENMRR